MYPYLGWQVQRIYSYIRKVRKDSPISQIVQELLNKPT